MWCGVSLSGCNSTISHHMIVAGRARLCHVNGGEQEQIRFLLGHVSVLTTERYSAASKIWRSPSTTVSGVYFLGQPWIHGKP